VSAQVSPKRPTRLPYTMPSVADQLLASCENSTRRQLIQDLSPRLLRQYSGRRLNRSSHGRSTSGSAPRVERCRADEAPQTSSPAYAAALQLLSPPVDLARERHRKGAKLAKPLAGTRPRRRARFMVSQTLQISQHSLNQTLLPSDSPVLMFSFLVLRCPSARASSASSSADNDVARPWRSSSPSLCTTTQSHLQPFNSTRYALPLTHK
jgi:hypothetical protein